MGGVGMEHLLEHVLRVGMGAKETRESFVHNTFSCRLSVQEANLCEIPLEETLQ
jgi:hypothetical protein